MVGLGVSRVQRGHWQGCRGSRVRYTRVVERGCAEGLGEVVAMSWWCVGLGGIWV